MSSADAVNRYACPHPGCLAGCWGVDDFPPEVVLTLVRPGYHWDGERLWCPKHSPQPMEQEEC